ncbi:MAG: GTP cyclohydrolase II RibA, partial [Acetobacteraceae bacterium]
MNRIRTAVLPPDGPSTEAGPGPDRLRAVLRAAVELRRGLPVMLDGPAPLVVLAAETATQAGLDALAALTSEPAALLLAPVRAAAVLHRPVVQIGPAVALRFPATVLTPAALHGLADPTEPQEHASPRDTVPTPAAAPAVLALAKVARLLPAVLVGPPTPGNPTPPTGAEPLRVEASDVLAYRAAVPVLRRVAEASVPLEDVADARIVAFRTEGGGVEHLAIVVGQPESREAPLVRLHSECFTGDLLGSLRCDCGSQLRGAIRRMAEEGAGILLYLAQEGRGIGLVNKLRAYALQDRGLDTLDANRALGWGADERNFLVAAIMLEALGVHRIRLLTNNPDKVAALMSCGIDVV